MNAFSILISDYDISEIKLPESVESLKLLPNHKIWDSNDIIKFLKKEYPKEILNTYDSLKPYAYKADFASYCILYMVGGWYSAITNTIIEVPNTNNIGMIAFKDIGASAHDKDYIAIACQLIYSKPHNLIFLDSINQIVDNVSKKYYGKNPLFVTGPNVLGKHFFTYEKITDYILGDFSVDGERDFKFSGINRVIAKYKKNNGGIVDIKGTNNYNDFWNNKDVYK
jgi:mannosyltransferase OCH1-like enzyme